MTVTYYSADGELIEPVWDRVHALGVSNDYKSNEELVDFPIDLDNDTTFWVFEKDGQFDTLAFRYDRVLLSGRGKRGYCMELYNEEVLPATTFELRRFVFDNPAVGGENQNYAVDIEL